MGYLIGNLLGRLLASYLIVWLVNLAIARGQWRAATRRTHRPLGIAAVGVVFVVGVAGFLLRGSA